MKHILIVDDSKTILHMLKYELSKEFEVTALTSGALALDFVKKRSTDMIIIDLEMPEMDGVALFTEIRKNKLCYNIPIVFLTGVAVPNVEVKMLELGADEFIMKPFTPAVVNIRIKKIFELYDLRHNLEKRLKEKSDKLEQMTVSTIMAIANVVDSKNKYTMGHSLRVAMYSKEIAKYLNWDEEDQNNIYSAGLLHDIAKIAVPDSILNKTEHLSNEEIDIIKQHPSLGKAILSDIDIDEEIINGVYSHHEKWDGTGYPESFKGEEIPVFARVIAIADSYDAMTSDRAYRKKLDIDYVIDEFEKGCGSQFDPDICRIFINMLKTGFMLEQSSEINYHEDYKRENSALLAKFLKNYTDELKAAANNDGLTGLLNRNSFEKEVVEELVGLHNGAFLMIDMDYFKTINDTYGHPEGDKILKLTADAIVEGFGKNEILCRFGGDEFAVFLKEFESVEDIERKLKNFQNIFKNKVSDSPQFAKVSVSIGVSLYPENGATFDELYHNADKALYLVKQNGKESFRFF